MKTTKEKIDEILGIKNGESVDDFLDGILSSNNENIKSEKELAISSLKKLKGLAKEDAEKAEAILNSKELKKEPEGKIAKILHADLDIQKAEGYLIEIEDLINLSKSMFRHVYENIVSSDLINPEIVDAAANMLESIHSNIAEFTFLYRDRRQFIDKLRLELVKQEHRKELLKLKYNLAMKRSGGFSDNSPIEAQNLVTFNQEEIVKLLNQKNLESKPSNSE